METPKSRLNEIAVRKLESLGLAVTLRPDGETLEGELPGMLRSPGGGKPLGKVRFVVVGHDQLLATAPAAVEGLDPISFAFTRRPEQLLAELERHLTRRHAAAQRWLMRLGKLKLDTELDGLRLRAVARVDLPPLGQAILEGDERGLRAAWAMPMGGRLPPRPLGDLPLDLDEFVHAVDLELHLFPHVEQALQGKGVAPPTPMVQPPAGGPTLRELIEKFGEDARVGPGLAITRDLPERGLRFAARLEPSFTFTGKLLGGVGMLWEGSFELPGFEGVEALADSHGGIPSPAASGIFALQAPAPPQVPEEIDSHIKPVAGEVWVMSMLIESDDGSQIAYVPVDIDGKAVGSARTLSKADFHATFEPAGTIGFRLPVRVIEVLGDQVSYVQLDPSRQPVGQAKRGAIRTFVSHFVPEAAAY